MTAHPINGNAAVLSVDRAGMELRCGRAVTVADGTNRVVAMALETLTEATLAALSSLSDQQPMLVLTSRRAATLRFETNVPLALPLLEQPPFDLQRLFELATVPAVSAAEAAAFGRAGRPANPAQAAALG